MVESVFTERQYREQQFYQEYSKRNSSLDVCFDPVTSKERRPWNSYWHVIGLAQQHFTTPGQRLLDFGCGSGEYSVLYAKIGYEVHGFDISPNNVALARARAEKYGLTEQTHFAVSAAETLDFPADYFDVIVGVDILHHVDINRAMSECFRVLKKGGIAIFHEPVRAPIFDYLRETRVGLGLVPKTVSVDNHLTEDERKLDRNDLKILKQTDPNMSAQRFLLTSRWRRFMKSANGQHRLEKLDQRLFQMLPFMKRFGGVMVATLRKP